MKKNVKKINFSYRPTHFFYFGKTWPTQIYIFFGLIINSANEIGQRLCFHPGLCVCAKYLDIYQGNSTEGRCSP
ncbi:hypothetical protein, partial [Salmonella sp. s51090]|uniref:hypothetical protein n=1 Tax=Salmonella sp. s51090 TaxID=3159651 RepID=UPI00397FA26E